MKKTFKPQKPIIKKNRYGQVSINARSSHGGAYTNYLVRYGKGCQGVTKTVSDLKEAERIADEILNTLATGRPLANIDDSRKLPYFIQCENALKGSGLSLWDCVTAALRDQERQRKTYAAVYLAEAIPHYIDNLRSRSTSQDATTTTQWALTKVANFFQKTPLVRISRLAIESYLQNEVTPGSRPDFLRRVKSALNYLIKKDLIDPRSADEWKKIELPKRPPKDPTILTPTDYKTLLQTAAQEDSLGTLYLVLAGFCALRSSEAQRLTWSALRENEGLIVLSSTITKTNRRRVVKIPDAAVKWVQHLKTILPLPENPDTRIFPTPMKPSLSAIKKASGVLTPRNVLRHSGVSYLVGLHEDAAKVSEWTGHTVTVLQTTYKANVTPTEVAEWFALDPSKCGSLMKNSEIK